MKRLDLSKSAVFTAVFLSMFLFMGKALLFDADIGLHVRSGVQILSGGGFPDIAMSTFHPTEGQWTVHEWLAEAAMAAPFLAMGLSGVVFLFAAGYALFFAVLYGLARDRGVPTLVAAAMTALSFGAVSYNLIARPHLASWFFLLAFVVLLERNRLTAERKHLYPLPALMALWANVHGGWFSGLLVAGLYATCAFLRSGAPSPPPSEKARARDLAVTLLALFASVCLNPYGPKIYAFTAKVLSDSSWVANITEYASPNFHDPYHAMFLYWLIFALSSLALSGRTLSWEETGLLAGHLYMGLYAVRAAPLFVVVSFPIVASAVARIARSWPVSAPRGWLTVPAASLATAAILAMTGAVSHGFDEKEKPVEAARYLRESGLPGNLFTNIQSGSYLVYEGWPNRKVFIDGRVDAYGKERFEDLIRIERMRPGWEEALDRYGIDVILYQTDSVFAWRLSTYHYDDWREAYEDDATTVFVRRGTPSDEAAYASAGR